MISQRGLSSPRVAFQGERGAYSEEAIAAIWPDGAEPVPMPSVRDVARAAAAGDVDAGVLAVENTLAGSVVASYDAFADCDDLYAVAEAVIGIHHCLLGPAGASLDGIEVVESHPVALAQCTDFLARHSRLRTHAASDTAGAAREIAVAKDLRRAAIAGRRAAHRYGLAVLADGIEDRPDNQTRFLAVGRKPTRLPPGTPARTSLVFTTVNEPGALVRALVPLTEHALNLSKLESRPTGNPWTYRFFADIEHTAGDWAREVALQSMRAATRTLRVLGTYARVTEH